MTIDQVLITDTLDEWRTTLNTTITRWNALGTASAITITGGTINGTIIGGTTPAAATFTTCDVNSTLDVRGATLLIDNDAISGDKISGGTAQLSFCELSGTPSANNHATTKAYVDDVVQDNADLTIVYAIVFG